MSLPPGFLDELRARTSLARVVGRKVTWDQRKSNQAKGDWWAPCPFHQEKTASFHVDDGKGFYYCFGCHAKGDAISFVRETENVGFMEAIEILAREAGMSVPAPDPRAKERGDLRDRLGKVMETALRHFRLQLSTAAGAEARAYLQSRGLDEAALARWEIGFAPDTRQSLRQHLSSQGIADDLLVQAGLVIRPDDGGTPFDRFRGRIMFPIRDASGRAIAFGGRAMSAAARAKYLNSPETPLFDKGRTLFNHAPAREAAGKGHPLIVAEGYMDVIALVQAGFEATVAPLGTAITEHQLRLLWRIAPEPVIALDGDTAGLRAAMRLIDLALPMLEAGHSLRFALLPEGMDPDDLIRSQGKAAMARVIEGARPMVDLLWQRETEGRVFDSPERRAALDHALRTAIARIPDTSVRRHYAQAVAERRAALFGLSRGQPGGTSARAGAVDPGRPTGQRGRPRTPPPSRQTALGTGSASGHHLREAVVLAIALTHPDLAAEHVDALEAAEMTHPQHREILAALLQCLAPALAPAGATGPGESPGNQNAEEGVASGTGKGESPAPADDPPLRDRVAEITGADTLEKLMSHTHLRIAPAMRRPDDKALAADTLRGELAWLAAWRGAERELEEALSDFDDLADEGLTWRLQQAAEARANAVRAATPADAGPEDDHDALAQQLQKLIDGEVWARKKR